MNNEKMREEFEQAYHEQFGRLPQNWDSTFGKYFDAHGQGAWWAWQSSRATLVIELPDCFETYGYSAEVARVATDCCADAMEEAGVSWVRR